MTAALISCKANAHPFLQVTQVQSSPKATKAPRTWRSARQDTQCLLGHFKDSLFPGESYAPGFGTRTTSRGSSCRASPTFSRGAVRSKCETRGAGHSRPACASAPASPHHPRLHPRVPSPRASAPCPHCALMGTGADVGRKKGLSLKPQVLPSVSLGRRSARRGRGVTSRGSPAVPPHRRRGTLRPPPPHPLPRVRTDGLAGNG